MSVTKYANTVKLNYIRNIYILFTGTQAVSDQSYSGLLDMSRGIDFFAFALQYFCTLTVLTKSNQDLIT